MSVSLVKPRSLSLLRLPIRGLLHSFAVSKLERGKRATNELPRQLFLDKKRTTEQATSNSSKKLIRGKKKKRETLKVRKFEQTRRVHTHEDLQRFTLCGNKKDWRGRRAHTCLTFTLMFNKLLLFNNVLTIDLAVLARTRAPRAGSISGESSIRAQ